MIDTKPTTNGHGPATLEAPVEANVKLSDWARSRKMYSRLIGALFLVGFLTYGVGSGLVTSLVGGSGTALAYLATMIVEVVLLSIGVLALLLIVPLAKHAGEAGAQTLGSILVQTNATAYQMGEMTLGVGAVFLCLLLFRTQLIPRWLAISGLIGYPVLVAGTIAEIFGIHIGLYLTIPGFFFELVLPFWLFFKGFKPDAYQGQTSV